ncbi:MAG: hypothetical protein J1F11_06135 [Oscillospiraceae bacterium]|nr:hypothetical protein [Oscillospiraceae bacterium]
MKHKLILSLALSAAILSACNGDTVQEPSSAEGEGTESYTTGSYQLHFSESLAEREEETGEASETEPEAETTAPEETEAEQTEAASVPMDALYRYIDLDFSLRAVFLDDDLICAPRSNDTGIPLVCQYDLDFYDLKEDRIVNTVSLPENFDVTEICAGSGNVLARVLKDTYDHQADKFVTSVAVIYDDFSFDIIDEPTAKDFYFEHYGHKISEWDIDLLCVDGEPEVIVPGYRQEGDEFGHHTKSQTYMFPIDEDRFVYRTRGNEWLPGFGIYDFKTGTAKNVPDSQDLFPIGGIHDGKIYSVKTWWDGFGTELYVTDTETLETSFFMDFPLELEFNAWLGYFMPENGKYILALKDGYKVDNTIYLIDSDTGEILKTYDDVPKDFNFYSIGTFIDDYSIAFSGTLDTESKLLVFSLDELHFPILSIG